jgi:hypothetical protein
MERHVDNEFLELLQTKTPDYKTDLYDHLTTNKKI